MTSNGAHPVIEINDLSKTYRLGKVEVHALRGVSATIPKGEILAIIGPSGSGKSSMMNILGCLDRPTAGVYRLDGVDVSSLSDNQLAEIRRSKIGFVFQTFNLLDRLTAVENVELPLIYSGGERRRERALEALERVRLGHRANHRPRELSGGEQQRVAIARALVNNPSVILADEPTGNLDTVVGQEIMGIFRELNQKEKITVVFVTHDREVAAAARRVIAVRDGLIIRDEVQRGSQP